MVSDLLSSNFSLKLAFENATRVPFSLLFMIDCWLSGIFHFLLGHSTRRRIDFLSCVALIPIPGAP
jgi:hypothetical protein